MVTADNHDNSEELVILFDGFCNLCSGIAQFIRKKDKDKKLRLANLQSETGQYFMKKYQLDIINYDSIIFIEYDDVFFKSEAAFQILKYLGGLWKILYVFKLLPKRLNNYFYDLIARNRYKIFGQRKSCFIID